AEVKPMVARLRARLNDTGLSDDERASVIASLVGVRKLDPQIVPAVASILGSTASVPLQIKALEALGNTRESVTGTEFVAAYARVPAELREALFGQLVKRTD